jgi:hypothetical protein
MSIPPIGAIHNNAFREQVKEEGDNMSPEEFKKTFQRNLQTSYFDHVYPAFQQQIQKTLQEQSEETDR